MLPLKEGMIRYAYERGLMVQPIVMFGVENAMSEYTFRVHPTQETLLEYYCDTLIDPKEFKTREEFHEQVQKRLYTIFDENHEFNVSEVNKRFKMLRHDAEKEAFNAVKDVQNRSMGMIEYNKEKRKSKRH